MKELQRITIGGKNWNDIIKLPCVCSLRRTYDHHGRGEWDGGFEVLLDFRATASQANETAHIGDTLVEYEDHSWEVVRRRDEHAGAMS